MTIYVDSMEAPKAIKSSFFWVPGQCNIVGNEIADEFTRCGFQSIDLPIGELSIRFKKPLIEETDKRFHLETDSMVSKAIWPANSIRSKNRGGLLNYQLQYQIYDPLYGITKVLTTADEEEVDDCTSSMQMPLAVKQNT